MKTKTDGILLAPSFIEEATKFTNQCRKLQIPYVFIDSDIPDQPSLSYIGPDLYHSGYLAANLISYLVGGKDRILIVNISAEIENHHHLLRKEDGFRGYFKEHNITDSIEKIDIRKISYNSIKKEISQALLKYKDIKVLFVTNAKVSFVAQYLKEANRGDIVLVGYDFLKENISYPEEENYNFFDLPETQESRPYKGIMNSL